MQTTAPPDLRVAARSNIFVMAALYADGRSVTPVRIRNISRSGALVEGAELPVAGGRVRLSRATLSATGMLVWVEAGKAGINFDEPVVVPDWLPQGRRGFGQQFVDELFHQKRLGAVRGTSAGDGGSAGIADELLELRGSLDRAAEELALDGSVASRHVGTLQAIDSVGQALARLAAEMALSQTPSTAARA
jgi:hypothetical protein